MVWSVLGCGVKAPPAAPNAGPAADEVATEDEPGLQAAPSGPAVEGVEAESLRELLHDHWEATMRRSPLWATALGDHRYDGKLGDNSEEGHQDDVRTRDGFLHRAQSMDVSALGAADALTLELFILELESEVSADVCRFRHWSIMPRGNALTTVLGLSDEHPIRASDVDWDRQSWLNRLQAVPAYLDNEIAQLRVGLDDGLVTNAHSLKLVMNLADRTLDKPTGEWTLAEQHDGCSGDETPEDPAKGAWNEAGCALLDGPIHDAVTRYRDAPDVH